MIEAYAIVLFLGTGLVWFLTGWQNVRLFRAFRDRYPQVANQEIPFAFDDQMSHPEKAFFFYRKRAADLLRNEPSLWRLRRQFIRLSVLSIVVPVVGFLPLLIIAVVRSGR